MPGASTDRWDSLWAEISRLQSAVRATHALHVNSSKTRIQAKEVVQNYFRETRPELVELKLETVALDRVFQDLLHLANGRNRKISYLALFHKLTQFRAELEAQRELRLGELKAAGAQGRHRIAGVESQITDTLRKLLPSSAASYEQAVIDLRTEGRLSFRGTALELREVLREVLDHLAPDEAVLKSEGFKLQKDRKAPTMKQKAFFILRSRGLPKTAIKAPQDALSLVEEHTARLARSLYERGSISTHVGGSRQEVRQLKMYVDGVLAELLEIHL